MIDLPRKDLPARWVAVVEPPIRTGELAYEVLRVRLNAVIELQEAAAAPLRSWRRRDTATVSGPPPETVHQLRVAVRRSVAALGAFEPWLAGRRRKGLVEALRDLRRSAGAARNCGVLEQRWNERSGESPSASWSLPFAWLALQRDTAWEDLEQAVRKPRRKLFVADAADLLGTIRYRGEEPEPTVGAYAAHRLRLAGESFVQGAERPEWVAAGRVETEAMHAVRIAGKRLRYLLEVFAPVLPADPCGVLYALVEELQERLGQVNDRATAATLLRNWLRAPLAVDDWRFLNDLLAEEERGIAADATSFGAWWNDRGASFRDRLEDLARAAESPVP